MNGKACKRLKRMFREATGREPQGTDQHNWYKTPKGFVRGHRKSEWRALKKAFKKSKSTSNTQK